MAGTPLPAEARRPFWHFFFFLQGGTGKIPLLMDPASVRGSHNSSPIDVLPGLSRGMGLLPGLGALPHLASTVSLLSRVQARALRWLGVLGSTWSECERSPCPLLTAGHSRFGVLPKAMTGCRAWGKGSDPGWLHAPSPALGQDSAWETGQQCGGWAGGRGTTSSGTSPPGVLVLLLPSPAPELQEGTAAMPGQSWSNSQARGGSPRGPSRPGGPRLPFCLLLGAWPRVQAGGRGS